MDKLSLSGNELRQPLLALMRSSRRMGRVPRSLALRFASGSNSLGDLLGVPQQATTPYQDPTPSGKVCKGSVRSSKGITMAWNS